MVWNLYHLVYLNRWYVIKITRVNLLQNVLCVFLHKFTFSFSHSRSQSNLYRPWFDENSDDTENDRARKAYKSVLTVTASSSSDSREYETFSKDVKKLSKEKFNYSYDEPVNNFVANFHDAVRKLNSIMWCSKKYCVIGQSHSGHFCVYLLLLALTKTIAFRFRLISHEWCNYISLTRGYLYLGFSVI